jgi:hypothetical protein
MSSAFIHSGLLGLLHLAATTLVAGGMGSPLSWSPDSAWLCYTVVTDDVGRTLEPGWLFDTAPPRAAADRTPVRWPAGAPSRGSVYRIWASPREDLPSVLIEESRSPVSAPSWSPRGKSVAYARFVPQLTEPNQAVQHGRWEVVIQSGLERREVVWSEASIALDDELRTSMPQLSCSWSRDGRYLAVPLPGPLPSLLIMRTDTKRRLHVLDRATFPAWSPDGTKLAFIRREDTYNSLQLVERRGQGFSSRALLETGPVTAAPCWTGDGRSLYVVVERVAPTPHELELVRYVVDTGEMIRVMSLAKDPGRRPVRVRGIALDFDAEAERCCFSVDIEGRDSDLAWSIPRDHEIQSRFSPLDPSQRISALAVAPDGRMAAMRFVTPEGLSPPALFDRETKQTALVVPDDASRQHWIALLAGTGQRLLREGLPPVVVDGRGAQRPTLLPLPGEVGPMANMSARLHRIGSFGASLCTDRAGRDAPALDSSALPPSVKVRRAHSALEPIAPEAPPAATDAEARLFFNYLRGDFRAAAADLEALDPHISADEARLALLSLRAQIRWSQGDHAEATAMIAYLRSCEGTATERIEETPAGPVVTTELSPRQAWARHLAEKVEQAAAPDVQPIPQSGAETGAAPLRSPFDEANAPVILDRERVDVVPLDPPAPRHQERRVDPFVQPNRRDIPPDPRPPGQP